MNTPIKRDTNDDDPVDIPPRPVDTPIVAPSAASASSASLSSKKRRVPLTPSQLSALSASRGRRVQIHENNMNRQKDIADKMHAAAETEIQAEDSLAEIIVYGIPEDEEDEDVKPKALDLGSELLLEEGEKECDGQQDGQQDDNILESMVQLVLDDPQLQQDIKYFEEHDPKTPEEDLRCNHINNVGRLLHAMKDQTGLVSFSLRGIGIVRRNQEEMIALDWKRLVDTCKSPCIIFVDDACVFIQSALEKKSDIVSTLLLPVSGYVCENMVELSSTSVTVAWKANASMQAANIVVHLCEMAIRAGTHQVATLSGFGEGNMLTNWIMSRGQIENLTGSIPGGNTEQSFKLKGLRMDNEQQMGLVKAAGCVVLQQCELERGGQPLVETLLNKNFPGIYQLSFETNFPLLEQETIHLIEGNEPIKFVLCSGSIQDFFRRQPRAVKCLQQRAVDAYLQEDEVSISNWEFNLVQLNKAEWASLARFLAEIFQESLAMPNKASDFENTKAKFIELLEANSAHDICDDDEDWPCSISGDNSQLLKLADLVKVKLNIENIHFDPALASTGTSAGGSGTNLASTGTSAGGSGTNLASSTGSNIASTGTSAGGSETNLASTGTSAGGSGTNIASSTGTNIASTGTSAGWNGTNIASTGTSARCITCSLPKNLGSTECSICGCTCGDEMRLHCKGNHTKLCDLCHTTVISKGSAACNKCVAMPGGLSKATINSGIPGSLPMDSTKATTNSKGDSSKGDSSKDSMNVTNWNGNSVKAAASSKSPGTEGRSPKDAKFNGDQCRKPNQVLHSKGFNFVVGSDAEQGPFVSSAGHDATGHDATNVAKGGGFTFDATKPAGAGTKVAPAPFVDSASQSTTVELASDEVRVVKELADGIKIVSLATGSLRYYYNNVAKFEARASKSSVKEWCGNCLRLQKPCSLHKQNA